MQKNVKNLLITIGVAAGTFALNSISDAQKQKEMDEHYDERFKENFDEAIKNYFNDKETN